MLDSRDVHECQAILVACTRKCSLDHRSIRLGVRVKSLLHRLEGLDCTRVGLVELAKGLAESSSLLLGHPLGFADEDSLLASELEPQGCRIGDDHSRRSSMLDELLGSRNMDSQLLD